MALRLDELLGALVRARVEFVVVGGVAANLHGSAHLTRDLDVVAPLTVENCRRVLEALGPHHPRFYQTVGQPPVARTADQLAEFRNLYLSTDLGVVDLLGELPPLGDFHRIEKHAVEVELFSLKVRVISLDDLIEVKAAVGRPKDKLVEMELRGIRERLAVKGRRL